MKTYLVLNLSQASLSAIEYIDAKGDADLLDKVCVLAVAQSAVPFGYDSLGEARRDYLIEEMAQF